MTLDQIILLITAGISLLAVFVTYLSVRKMGKQVDIQKSQWEYSQKPIFRIIKFQNFSGKWVFIIENSNSVFHEVERVTFTTSDVLISGDKQGRMETAKTRNGVRETGDVFQGLSVTLIPQIDTFTQGIIQIRGKDLLGNTFICNSQPIKFNNRKIINEHDFNRAYFNYL